MLQQVVSRSVSIYPWLYMQFAALVGLLIAAEFSMGTLGMMLTQRAVHRVSQKVRRVRQVRTGRLERSDRNGCCA